MSNDSVQPTSIEVQAVVIRADGTREELGTISYWHQNPVVRLLHRLKNRKLSDNGIRSHDSR